MKSTRFALSLTLIASLVAACSGGGGGGSSIPAGSQTSAVKDPQILARRIYYTRSYLKAHPELTWGAQAAFNRHTESYAAGTAGTNNLIWNGGPVEHTPKVYLIFWGWQSSSDATADPSGVASYLNGFMNSIGASSWINIDSQYNDSIGNVGNPSAQLGGVWYDSSRPPQVYAQSDIAGEALAGVTHFGYDSDANYFVATPHNYTTSGFGTQWCAYHSATNNSTGGLVSYTDFPYIPDAGFSCGANFVNANGPLDGVSIVGGHEEAETQTDPNASTGWIDATGQEIGDKCAWSSMSADVTFPDGQSYPVQPLWSNAVSGCAMTYGSVATPSPTPIPTPTPTPVPTATPTPKPPPTPSPSPTPCARRHHCH